ncbi:HAD-IIB family hydrolase [Calycomorphotria hydatis]|uniref:sucrose-phosphate synthase n=1 Tax=Calycomorphotria hydatis TaxID=2528027 RepID=A0A517TAU0_9PLAN|nr:HAD-IIB family hydrolase [Calycomorphotria hydatis]QDT65485.1 Mannosylfructose-phosphate synthase [Calycomorphotria hydatis]
MTSNTQRKIVLISLHGLIRAQDCEYGRDVDTGGQIKYVLELASELARQPGVGSVELLTRQIFDPKVSSDYSQVEEVIEGNAKIVRIPFGPRRYLRKEALWPYIDIFIDQTLHHFRRTGLPDLIHGHYADAGLAGAQLARLLHIPFVFTGHSLGRVKKQRLVDNNVNEETIEKRYRISTRIEAEEFALETASMVVASTNQEVEQQYEIYEHYIPERMEVIPPGVDLKKFRPPTEDDPLPPFKRELDRFLNDPDKPIILTLARLDERKNLEMLFRVFGESEELREKANLVVLMGIRQKVGELPAGQRKILHTILALIDDYNLYGQVAYPKTHESQDVQDLYRYTAQLGGAFINPALTEPFGLTLLEAAASGLPIVATNDGGPRDIIANCENGLLIDPLNHEEIESALLQVIDNPEQWKKWSTSGLEGAHKHYSWANHASRYMRDVNEIVEHSARPVLAETSRVRRLPEFDRLIITDLDNTLTGDDEALEEFCDLIRNNTHLAFGIATGRRIDDAMRMIEELNLPMPELLDTSCGTELHYGHNLTEDRSWRAQIDFNWHPDKIRSLLDTIDGLTVQSEQEQATFKISYEYDGSVAPKIPVLKRILREEGIRCRLILSLDMFLDVLPVRGGSDYSLRHVLYKWGFAPENVLVAGDSGNDEGMLKGRTLGVVVANHAKELNKLRRYPRVFFASQSHARGILEGIDYYNFLGHIQIPNDEIEST